VARYSPQEVTLLLQDWRRGDQGALDKLIPLIYDKLHSLAHAQMAREKSGHILQTTALVNEAYLRLVQINRLDWKDRAHFFAMSATVMRRILVEFARARGSQKRGAESLEADFDGVLAFSPCRDADLIALDDALEKLAVVDPRAARVVDMRYFGGLSVQETAEVLKVSENTAKRDWTTAKLWLLRELKHGEQKRN